MNIVTSFENYNNNNILLTEPIKNTVINNSEFIRIYYSNSEITLNGVYLFIDLSGITLEPYYNKFKCNFPLSQNNKIITKIEEIEKDILSKHINNNNKKPEFSIYNQIKNGYIKIFTSCPNKYKQNNNIQLILKISGLWENETQYGATFKFIPIME